MLGVAPDTIGIALPEEWTQVPLDPAGFADYFRAEVAAHRDELELSDSDVRNAEVFLEQIRAAAVRAGALLVAGLVAVDDTSTNNGESEPSKLVTATVVLTAVGRDTLKTDVPLTPDVLLEGASRHQLDPGDGARLADIEPPELVPEFGSNGGVKLTQLLTASTAKGELKAFVQTYLLPDKFGDYLAVAQFSTTNLDFARDFAELFSAMGRTVRMIFPEEPTFVEPGES